jgi:acyl carrier protein
MNTTSIDTPTARFRRCLPASVRDADETTRLRELTLDSMDTVDFLCAVQAEFGVRLEEGDLNPQQTLRGLFATILSR